MKLFTKKNDLSFNAELLSQNAGYLRNALVMDAVEEAPEGSYLQKIIVDALTSHHTDTSSQSKAQAKEKYEMIGNYHVAHYEEKPFETNKESLAVIANDFVISITYFIKTRLHHPIST